MSSPRTPIVFCPISAATARPARSSIKRKSARTDLAKINADTSPACKRIAADGKFTGRSAFCISTNAGNSSPANRVSSAARRWNSLSTSSGARVLANNFPSSPSCRNKVRDNSTEVSATTVTPCRNFAAPANPPRGFPEKRSRFFSGREFDRISPVAFPPFSPRHPAKHAPRNRPRRRDRFGYHSNPANKEPGRREA